VNEFSTLFYNYFFIETFNFQQTVIEDQSLLASVPVWPHKNTQVLIHLFQVANCNIIT